MTSDLTLNRVVADYAGPLKLKMGLMRRPVIISSYVCVFVSLSVGAVYLELVSHLITEAFVACLRRFVSS